MLDKRQKQISMDQDYVLSIITNLHSNHIVLNKCKFIQIVLLNNIGRQKKFQLSLAQMMIIASFHNNSQILRKYKQASVRRNEKQQNIIKTLTKKFAYKNKTSLSIFIFPLYCFDLKR
ncbi:unnamed protein product [Paramecium sonneborni]|uniref:Uncharacterized protein n=1 Tax=Paramecium sonneborni TaxID=65129 RepID=A0A8S1RSX5_9CILI|nr:unnamed protein product [Paramecium sonneborni]